MSEPNDPPLTPPPVEDGALRGASLRRQASVGLFVVGTRGVAVLALGFVGYIVLARLLSPREFGVYAVGLVFVSVAALLSDGGLGAGLIRRPEPPTDDELRSLVAFQLVVTMALALIVLSLAPWLGQSGWIAAILVGSMPLVAFQFPARILLERSLNYRPVAVVEVSQVLAYHSTAIGLVLVGLGVWGLALAFVARTLVGTALMAKVSPVGLLAPRFSWQRIRPLMAFGVRFQANTGTELVRDQGMNWAIAIVANVSTLGLWSLVRRLLEAPLLLVDTFGRVAFSAMARLVEVKEDSAGLMERVVGIAVVGTGAVLAGLAGAAPGLIPGVFGEQWTPAAAAVPWTCLALAISGSVAVTARSYLYAVGDAAAVLRASSSQAAAVFVVTLPLLRLVGVGAVGIGWLVAAVVEAALLSRFVRRRNEAALIRPLVVPLVVGVGFAVLGWQTTVLLMGGAGVPALAAGTVGGVVAGLGFLLGMFILNRQLLVLTVQFAVRAVRSGFGGDTSARPA